MQEGYQCLKHIRSLEKQIDLLKRQLTEIQSQVVQDRVDASSHSFPYTQYSLIIKGVAYEDSQRVARYKRRLEKKLRELLDAKDEALEFISKIDDREIQTILQLRYIEGLSWDDVASSTNYADGSAPRKRIKRFLENFS